MKRLEKITKHGSERFSERLDIKSASKKERQSKLAYERGFGRNDVLGVSKKLIDFIVNTENREGCVEVKVYCGALYIYGMNGNLITVYKLDKECNKLYEGARRKINRRKDVA